MMPTTTFRKLREANACADRYAVLKSALPGRGDDDPITLLEILDANGLDDALWALRACDDAECFARLLMCDYAEHVLPYFEREFPNDTRRFARGEEAADALAAAADAVWAAADAGRDAAWAARDAARAAADAARDAERTWQEQRLRELLR